jgi:hypothetical protein
MNLVKPPDLGDSLWTRYHRCMSLPTQLILHSFLLPKPLDCDVTLA